jgi:hypothetical protein
LPESARAILRLLIDTFSALEVQIKELDGEINRRSTADPAARRLMTIQAWVRLLPPPSRHLCQRPGASEPDAISPLGWG